MTNGRKSRRKKRTPSLSHTTTHTTQTLSFIERIMTTEVSFPSADNLSLNIYGNFTLPSSNTDDAIPAILIINGSGPIDRDGNAPSLRLSLNTSNRFAEHMSKRTADEAIAVFCYDKRGVGKSIIKGDKNLFYRTGLEDLVSDAVEAVRYLANHPRIDKKRIVICGHSEGAIIMPLICRDIVKSGLDPPVGCIFYGGFGDNLKDAMESQQKRAVEEVKEMSGFLGWLLRRFVSEEKIEKQQKDMMEKINADDKPDYISMQLGLVKQPAKWIREHFESQLILLDSLREHMTCHCLAITGMKDVQVNNIYCDTVKAKELIPNAASIESHRPVNLTHALRSLEGPAKLMNIKKDYAFMSTLPLDKELLDITDKWCDRILFGAN